MIAKYFLKEKSDRQSSKNTVYFLFKKISGLHKIFFLKKVDFSAALGNEKFTLMGHFSKVIRILIKECFFQFGQTIKIRLCFV